MNKQIIGLGGGGFTMESNPLLDLYILASCNKKNPTICFLPTASADNPAYIEHFKETFADYPCNTRYLPVFNPRIKDYKSFLLESDIIYVGGGNTKSMLGLWREWCIDNILIQAYDQGTVLAGVSAGFVCWFKECITDSFPKIITSMKCLDILKWSACPHYDSQEERQQAYDKMLLSGDVGAGFAVEDGVGLHFINGELVRAVTATHHALAYKLSLKTIGSEKEVEREIIYPEVLQEKQNFEKYISCLFEERQAG